MLEKKPISRNAIVGIYMFSKGKYFLDSAIEMIINNDRVNNEFYTCPVYNYLIKNGKKIIGQEVENVQDFSIKFHQPYNNTNEV